MNDFVHIYGKPPLTQEEATKHIRYAAGLRELADWIEAHPTITLPSSIISCYTVNEREEASEILAALKPCKKYYNNEFFNINRDFGPITLNFIFYRNRVCVAKVVGKKIVPEVREPAKVIEIPERITPEHEVDIIEWDCSEPLLGTTEAEAA